MLHGGGELRSRIAGIESVKLQGHDVMRKRRGLLLNAEDASQHQRAFGNTRKRPCDYRANRITGRGMLRIDTRVKRQIKGGARLKVE